MLREAAQKQFYDALDSLEIRVAKDKMEKANKALIAARQSLTSKVGQSAINLAPKQAPTPAQLAAQEGYWWAPKVQKWDAAPKIPEDLQKVYEALELVQTPSSVRNNMIDYYGKSPIRRDNIETHLFTDRTDRSDGSTVRVTEVQVMTAKKDDIINATTNWAENLSKVTSLSFGIDTNQLQNPQVFGKEVQIVGALNVLGAADFVLSLIPNPEKERIKDILNQDTYKNQDILSAAYKVTAYTGSFDKTGKLYVNYNLSVEEYKLGVKK